MEDSYKVNLMKSANSDPPILFAALMNRGRNRKAELQNLTGFPMRGFLLGGRAVSKLWAINERKRCFLTPTIQQIDCDHF